MIFSHAGGSLPYSAFRFIRHSGRLPPEHRAEAEQVAPPLGLRRHQREAREVDHRDEVLRNGAGARLGMRYSSRLMICRSAARIISVPLNMPNAMPEITLGCAEGSAAAAAAPLDADA